MIGKLSCWDNKGKTKNLLFISDWILYVVQTKIVEIGGAYISADTLPISNLIITINIRYIGLLIASINIFIIQLLFS